MRPIIGSSRWLIPAAGALWGLLLGAGLVSGWALWDRSLDVTTFGYYADRVLTDLPGLSLLLLLLASLLSALAIVTTSRRLLSRSPSLKAVLVLSFLLSMTLLGNVGLWVFATPASSDAIPASCSYDVFLSAGSPLAWSERSHETIPANSTDVGTLASSVAKSNQVVCFEPGYYTLATTIRVVGQTNVTLDFSRGASLASTHPIRLLQIMRSSYVKVLGGTWVGTGRGNFADIEIDEGSTNITVEGADVSRAGHDGVFIRNDTTPNSGISVVDNYLHDNDRYGVQAFENGSAGSLGILIAGNGAVDNRAGGIYTNGVGGAKIVGNVVSGAAGARPGLIGIGVTNGGNDTVTGNRVDHMFWYGIQVYYNNDTLVSDNYAGFDAGGSDQSGITNDHSFYDVILNNTVVSNGQTGIYVERSSYVTIEGNNATGNAKYGIEFFHGDAASTAHAIVTGNVCSYNGQAGIVMNSGVDSAITDNRCLDNSGPGVLLYNDEGQVGSSGNLIANNSLGDDRSSPSSRTQTYGVRTVGQADNNTIAGNSLFNNTVANMSIAGTVNVVRGNVESPAPVTAVLTRTVEARSSASPL